MTRECYLREVEPTRLGTLAANLAGIKSFYHKTKGREYGRILALMRRGGHN